MTIDLPAHLEVLSTQALVALPSTRIMQVPQAPSEQPFFTEVSPSVSRRKVRSFSSFSETTCLPLTVIVTIVPSSIRIPLNAEK